jgi:hypothetical protein
MARNNGALGLAATSVILDFAPWELRQLFLTLPKSRVDDGGGVKKVIEAMLAVVSRG